MVGMSGLEPLIFALSERCTNRLCYIPKIVGEDLHLTYRFLAFPATGHIVFHYNDLTIEASTYSATTINYRSFPYANLQRNGP